ncbi:MAG: nucleotidyltransferase substrate binding protein [Clostridia bacterium]|nr:nucleotidyltransferase substrate binding protein [Clostridia bacterium]
MYEIFSKELDILQPVDYNLARENVIYRTGIVFQFYNVFDSAWKAMQEVLKSHGANPTLLGSPREIIKLGFSYGFVNDEEAWLGMLKDRNIAAHVYNENKIIEMLNRIKTQYTAAFINLKTTLAAKIAEIEEDNI